MLREVRDPQERRWSEDNEIVQNGRYRWENCGRVQDDGERDCNTSASASLSPTGKRALLDSTSQASASSDSSSNSWCVANQVRFPSSSKVLFASPDSRRYLKTAEVEASRSRWRAASGACETRISSVRSRAVRGRAVRLRTIRQI